MVESGLNHLPVVKKIATALTGSGLREDMLGVEFEGGGAFSRRTQHGIQPYSLHWFTQEPICSRSSSIEILNSLGGTPFIFHLPHSHPLSLPSSLLFTLVVDIPPNESWWTPGKIVSLDPWGHSSDLR
ncbi:hypothetical protein D9758_017002 [Tetrapyrgos nigripes]|uniref:Uncharacterized protein n=1 Tax=Tetrapyrgos nigripes TaxID=182062 RepID=A0A8H5C0K3_9AGAR|nr:hypothetical protein D9758_017002 [Tetrapyrgos nigripes]